MHSQQQQNKSIKQTNSLPQLYDGWNNVQTLTPKDQSTELSENGMKRTYCNQCCSFRLRLIFHTMCVDFLRLWHNFFHASSFSYFVVGRVFCLPTSHQHSIVFPLWRIICVFGFMSHAIIQQSNISYIAEKMYLCEHLQSWSRDRCNILCIKCTTNQHVL